MPPPAGSGSRWTARAANDASIVILRPSGWSPTGPSTCAPYGEVVPAASPSGDLALPGGYPPLVTAPDDRTRAFGDRPPTAGQSSVSDSLRENLTAVEARLRAAALAAKRDAPDLIAVTKTVSPATALALHRLGCKDLAENRAPVLREKVDAATAVDAHPRWHFIGHLQRNKARRVVECVHVLHSVDSLALAETVARLKAEGVGAPTLEVFVEVNLTGEPTKHGLSAGDASDVVERLADAAGVHVLGLMAMGPLSGHSVRTADDVFAETNDLARRLEGTLAGAFHTGRCQLSMGMSGDLESAIRHGSDYVRVGSALFEGIEPA